MVVVSVSVVYGKSKSGLLEYFFQECEVLME